MDEERGDPPGNDELLARLRAKVEERRRSGQYPPGLEDELSTHFRRIVGERVEPQPMPDFAAALREVEAALGFDPLRFPLESQLPLGRAMHQAVARTVGRQVQGVFQQVQAFGHTVQGSLDLLGRAIEGLAREVRDDVVPQVAAAYEQAAANERAYARLEGVVAALEAELERRLKPLEDAAGTGRPEQGSVLDSSADAAGWVDPAST